MSLQKKVVSGIFWTFGQQFGSQVIVLVTSIILARILQPSDFGLIGMLTLFMGIGSVLIDGGFTNSLIRTQDIDQEDYSSVFFINIIASVIIYGAIFFSPLIASFYNKPVLVAIIRVYTLSFIINAFATVQITKLTRELKFRLQMAMQLPSLIISGVVGIFMALHGYGVWSLVWVNIINSIIFATLHWLLSGWHPSWLFNMKKMKQHLRFGYKLTFSGTLDILFENIYNIVIGRFYPVASLGYYTRSQTLSMLPVQAISMALNKVSYPLFATIQDDDVRLKAAYKKIMLVVIFWVTIVMICLQVIATPLFRMVLTDKWLPAVPFFKILCINGILYPLHLYNLNILLVKGRSDLFLKLEIYKKIIIAAGVISFISFGIYALICFQVAFSIGAFFINTLYSGKLIKYSIKEQIIDLLPNILTGIITGVLGWALNIFFLQRNQFPDWLGIIIGAGVCVCIYSLLSYLFKMTAMFDTFEILLKKNKNDSDY